MSDPYAPRPYRGLTGLIVLVVAGVAALGVALWLGRQEAETPAKLAATPSAAKPDSGKVAPSFDIVRVGPSGDAVLAGRAAPGAVVSVLRNGTEIGRVTADAGGQWVFLPPQPLPPGGQELSLASRQPDGTQLAAAAPVLLVVPDHPSLAAGDAAPGIAVLVPKDGPPRLLQGPSSGNGGQLGLDVVDYAPNGAIRFAGTAPPGSVIRLYVDDAPIGDATADASGHWSLSPSAIIAVGPHRLRLDQLAGDGKVAARAELPFARAELTAKGLLPDHIVVQPAQSLWRIARSAYGEGIRYTDIYAANRDQIRDPNLIYPGQVFAMPALTPSASSTSR